MTPDELREARHRLGLSQSQLAAALALPLNTLQNWEQGQRTVPFPTMLRLALERLAEQNQQNPAETPKTLDSYTPMGYINNVRSEARSGGQSEEEHDNGTHSLRDRC